LSRATSKVAAALGFAPEARPPQLPDWQPGFPNAHEDSLFARDGERAREHPAVPPGPGVIPFDVSRGSYSPEMVISYSKLSGLERFCSISSRTERTPSPVASAVQRSRFGVRAPCTSPRFFFVVGTCEVIAAPPRTCGERQEKFEDFFGDSVRRSGTFGAVSFRFDERRADAR
jgi:hypothetical protein